MVEITKYYTPTIDEFIPGFEYEVYIGAWVEDVDVPGDPPSWEEIKEKYNNIWVKRTVPDDSQDIIEKQLFDNRIRVKR